MINQLLHLTNRNYASMNAIVYGTQSLSILHYYWLVTGAVVHQSIKIRLEKSNDREIEQLKFSVHKSVWPYRKVGVVDLVDKSVQPRR